MEGDGKEDIVVMGQPGTGARHEPTDCDQPGLKPLGPDKGDGISGRLSLFELLSLGCTQDLRAGIRLERKGIIAFGMS